MVDAVLARLTTSRRLGADAAFPFADFPLLLRSLEPRRLTLAFERSGPGVCAVDVALQFDAQRETSVRLFQEALIRAEPDLDFECELRVLAADGAAWPHADDDSWTRVEIAPEQAALPSGRRIGLGIPLDDVAVAFLAQAEATDSRAAYVLDFERVGPAADDARALVAAIAELRRSRRDVGGLREAVGEVFETMRAAGWSVRERLCIERGCRDRDGPWTEALLREHLARRAPFLPEELLPLVWDAPTAEADFAARVLRRRGPAYLGDAFARIVPSSGGGQVLADGLAAARARTPAAAAAPGDYLFVSYAHLDGAFVEGTLLPGLEAIGARYWYDTGIHTGARWDEELEQRIRDAGGILACVSGDYERSKYCKRELKFADLLDKAIIPVSAAPWCWGPGLQMMFQELQITALADDASLAKVRDSLELFAPGVLH